MFILEDLIEGDIAKTQNILDAISGKKKKANGRDVLTLEEFKWPSPNIPYEIDSSVGKCTRLFCLIEIATCIEEDFGLKVKTRKLAGERYKPREHKYLLSG